MQNTLSIQPLGEFTLAEEFQTNLDEMPALKAAFEALTPGRQRVYLLHFSQPKQAQTRLARGEKYIPQILDGIGHRTPYLSEPLSLILQINKQLQGIKKGEKLSLNNLSP